LPKARAAALVGARAPGLALQGSGPAGGGAAPQGRPQARAAGPRRAAGLGLRRPGCPWADVLCGRSWKWRGPRSCRAGAQPARPAPLGVDPGSYVHATSTASTRCAWCAYSLPASSKPSACRSA